MNFKKVLIIDDEHEICLLLGNMLKSMGYSVSTAQSIEDGYLLYVKERPAIVFVDLNLPDGSGFSLMRLIMNTDNKVQVVIISAQDGVDERKIADERGAIHFIGKPLNRNLVLEAIDAIEHKHQNS